MDVRDALQRGLRAHLDGDHPAAEEIYEAILAADGACGDALNLLGVVRKSQGRIDEAIALLRRAVAVGPGAPAYWQNLGNALVAGQLLAEAAEAYERAVSLDAANPDLRAMLVDTLYRQAAACGDRERAKACLRRLLAVDEGHLDAIALLLSLLNFQGASDLAHRPWAFDRAGEAYRRLLGDLQEAAVLAHRAWAKAPTEARYQTLWSLCYWVIGDQDFVDSDPADAIRWVALGNGCRRQSRRAAAEHAYRTALAIRPGHPMAQFRLASLLLSCNRFDEADTLLRAIDAGHRGRQEAMRFSPDFIDFLRARPLPPSPVEITVGDGAGLMIFCACDGIYFDKFADRLLHSAHVNAGIDLRFHLHVINPPPDIDATIRRYRAFLDGMPITCSTERIAASDLGDSAKAIYASARFFLLPHLLAAYRKPILMLDVDTLVVGSLSGFAAAAGEGDFALICGGRDFCEPWEWMYAGQIYVNNTERALDYFSLVSRYVAHFIAEGRATWFLDQIALAACWSCGYRDRPRPQLIEMSNDITHQGMFIKDHLELPIPPEVLFWPSYASTGNSDGLNVLTTFQRYVIPE